MKSLICPRCRVRIRFGTRHCLQCNYRFKRLSAPDHDSSVIDERSINLRDNLTAALW